MSNTFDLLIIFWDGSRRIVSAVTNYGISNINNEIFWYEKNRSRNYLPVDKVNFIGRLSNWEG